MIDGTINVVIGSLWVPPMNIQTVKLIQIRRIFKFVVDLKWSYLFVDKMPLCAAYKCKERGVHRFPKNPALRKLWENALKRKAFRATDSSRLCRNHFKTEDYFGESAFTGMMPQHNFLKKSVVPSVFLWTKDVTPVGLQREVRHLDRRKRKILQQTAKDSVSGAAASCSNVSQKVEIQALEDTVSNNESSLSVKNVLTMGNFDWKQLTCQECKANFSTRSNLFRHLRTQHRIVFPKLPSKVFCEHCGKGFVNILSINRHVCKKQKAQLAAMLRAKREKNVSCQICSETFAASYIMYRHMRNIHKSKPKMSISRRLQCAYCDATLITHKAMDMHLCTEHKITLEIDKLKFDSFESFSMWKHQIEAEQGSYFVRRNSIGPHMYFYCQRSGHPLPEKQKSQNKKLYNLNKSRTSIKIGKCCPARIVLKIEEGEMIVLFHKIHIGHRQLGNTLFVKNEQIEEISTVKLEEAQAVIDSQRQAVLVEDMIDSIYGNLDSVRQLLLCVPPENIPLILEETEQFQKFVESLALKDENVPPGLGRNVGQ